MSSSSNTSIAKKARTKAEADFTTWLMMAKLGGFDDLPSNAQTFLINYRTRLETMSEAESTALVANRGAICSTNHKNRVLRAGFEPARKANHHNFWLHAFRCWPICLAPIP